MNIDILDEDGASNIDHPELFGKQNKSELIKHLEKCEQIVQTWPEWKRKHCSQILTPELFNRNNEAETLTKLLIAIANFKSNNVEIHVTIETESSFTKPSICMSIYTNNDLDKSDPFRYINRFYINGSRDYSRFHPCSISAMEAIECLDKTAGDYKFNLNDWSDRFESFDSELPF